MDSKQRQFKRLYLKIKKLLNTYMFKCIFLTMSFNESILKTTNEQTRERYIKQFLRTETAVYICNKDYGKKGNREHYHALIITSTLNKNDFKDLESYKQNKMINLKAYKYGNIKADFIGIKYRPKNDIDFNITALNITKHFYKDTAKQSRIITSRKPPTKINQIRRLERYKESLKDFKDIYKENNYIDLILNDLW